MMPRRTSSSTNTGAERVAPQLAEDVAPNIEEKRDALILEKRTELSQIYDRHDDLVRAKQPGRLGSFLKGMSRCENCFIWKNMFRCCPIILRYVFYALVTILSTDNKCSTLSDVRCNNFLHWYPFII